jgi:threonine/homoserine/homoserine lactone efflux protein
MLGHAFAVTALKSSIFFVAFLPQFLDPARGLLWQLVVMEATFLVLVFSNAMAAARLATRARTVARDERAPQAR